MTNDTSYREKGRAVFLAAIMVLSVVAMSAAFAGGVAASAHEASPNEVAYDSVDGERFWQGESVHVTGLDNNEGVDVLDADGNLERERAANGTGTLVLDTTNLDAGDYSLAYENQTAPANESFEINVQDFDEFAFTDDSVAADGSSTLEVESNRRSYNVQVSADGLSGDDLGNIFGSQSVHNDSDDDVAVLESTDGIMEFDADFSGIDAGNYTFEADVVDTTASAESTITVEAGEESDITLTENAPDVTQGDVAEIGLELSGDSTDTPFDIQFNEGNEGYDMNATVDPGGESEVTVSFNTYFAGQLHQENVSDSDLISASGDATVTEVNENLNLSSILAAGVEYDIDVGTDLDDPQAVGSLFVSERSGETGLNVYRSANDPGDFGDASAIAGATGDTLVESDTLVYDGDVQETLALEISTDAYEGMFAADDFAGLAENGSLDLAFEQDVQGNTQPRTLNLSASQFETVEDFENGSIYVVADSDNLEFDGGDLASGQSYTATFTLQDGHLLGEEDSLLAAGSGDNEESAEAAFATEAEDSSFATDPLMVPADEGATIEGSSNLAPGSSGSVVVSSDEAEERFRMTTEDVEVGSDGSFAAEFDFSGTTEGDTFTASARNGITIDGVSGEVGEGEPPANLQGAVSAPDTVNVDDDASLELEIENTGGEAGSAPWSISVGGEEVDSGTAELDAGASTTASHDFDTSETGETDWSVSFNDSELDSGTLTVEEDDEDTTDTGNETDEGETDEGDDDGGDDGGDDGQPGFGIAVALFALIGAALLALRRQN